MDKFIVQGVEQTKRTHEPQTHARRPRSAATGIGANDENQDQRSCYQLQPFASLLDAQPPEVQEAFQFLLATAMHEGGNPRLGKFELLNVAEVDGKRK